MISTRVAARRSATQANETNMLNRIRAVGAIPYAPSARKSSKEMLPGASHKTW